APSLSVVRSAIVQVIFICILAITAGVWISLAWFFGMVALFPLFSSLRQLLEHRDIAASRDLDYGKVPHGAVSRLFGSGLIASTFGGAGFNRHLLHHWDPLIPCTRLIEVERFLLDTSAAGLIRQATTSYWRTFLGL